MKILKNFLFTIILAELVIYLMIFDMYGLAIKTARFAYILLKITVSTVTRRVFGICDV